MIRDKLIIQVRINEYALRGANPHVPYSPEEIAADGLACGAEGAAIIHYHARDAVTGAPATDTALYADTARRIKAASDLLILPTLGAWTLPSPEARIAHVVEMARDPATFPELAPIDMATSNVDVYDSAARRFRSDDTVYINTAATWQYFAKTMREVGVKPVQALWNISSVRYTEALVEMGVFAEPLLCELVLTEHGLLAGHPGTVKGLQAFLDFLPARQRWHWSVMCAGGNLFAVAAAALERGGHISIGLGDYPYPELGQPRNADLVARIVSLARAIGREVATPSEARTLLGLG
ncbi:MAG: 3-keto-5-aminohexanoate cleavage protein [Gammaproteobacteria bacterium]